MTMALMFKKIEHLLRSYKRVFPYLILGLVVAICINITTFRMEYNKDVENKAAIASAITEIDKTDRGAELIEHINKVSDEENVFRIIATVSSSGMMLIITFMLMAVYNIIFFDDGDDDDKKEKE